MKKIIILTFAAILAFPALTSAQKNTALHTDLVSLYNAKTPKTHTFNIKYQGDVLVGFAISDKAETTDFSRPFVETTHGIRITKYAFIGAGAGLQYAYGELNPGRENSPALNTLLIPVFANVKAYCPVNNRFAPYLTLNLGGSFVASANEEAYGGYKPSGGLYCKFGVGLNYRSLVFDLGLMHQNVDNGNFSNNSFYVNVGFMF